jgi:Na+(H+)/acetate symporter ActP
VLALSIAPRLRGLGAYTPGDVLAARLGGFRVRLAWAGVAFCVSFLLLVAVLKVTAPLLSTLLPIPTGYAFYGAAGLIAFAAFPGGFRSLTWAHAVQYFVIALACVMTAFFVIERNAPLEAVMADHLERLADLSAWTAIGVPSLLSLLLTIAGTATFPHLLTRVLTMRPVSGAGSAMVWGVLFSAAVLVTGVVLADLLAETAIEGASGDPIQRLAAELGGLPAVLIGLVFAGGLASLLALGQLLLFAATAALSHDVWDEIVDPTGAEGRRIVVARLIVVAVGWASALAAASWQTSSATLLEWAFALAAAGAFLPLLLGLWWSRCSGTGAAAGMLAGLGVAGAMFLMEQGLIEQATAPAGWISFGPPLAGMLVALVVTLAVSLVMPSPKDEDANGAPASHGAPPIRERPA